MYQGYKFIDSDSHILEPADMFEQYLEAPFRSDMPRAWVDYQGEPLGFGISVTIPAADSDQDYVMPFGRDPMPDDQPSLGDAGTRIVMPEHNDAYAGFARKGFPPELYKLALERTGIDYMVIYPTVGLYVTAVPQLKADTAAAYRRAYNNWLHDFCTEAGDRVVGAASIDLRDPDEAIREARRCVKDFGFKAVHINPTPVGEYRMYDAVYDRLWSTLEDLDVPLAIHVGAGNAADEMLYYYLPRLRSIQGTMAFTMGNMIASAALIMGGVLERHPKLRVVHLESGAGWVAFWIDRMDAGVQGGFRDLENPGLKLHPIDYFQRQCYIAADQDDPGIKQVIEVMGDDNIVTATDFGHPEGRKYAGAAQELLGLPGVSEDSKRKIMWDNALRLYPLKAA